MDIQFDNESVDENPDPNKLYYYGDRYFNMSASGFSYLMKLVLLIDKYPELINKIKDYEKQINYQNSSGMTALMIACCNSFCSIKVIQELIKLGSEINKCCHTEHTALSYLCHYRKSNDTVEIVKELINSGADVNVTSFFKHTPLMTFYQNQTSFDNSEIIEIFKDDIITFSFKNIWRLLEYVPHVYVLDRLCDINRNDTSAMVKILPHLPIKKRQEWCKFIANICTINESILKHRANVYEKPGNIISLCGEFMFNKKQNKYMLPNKLKFLFDIKNEEDCMNKIDYYLHNSN